MTGDPPAGLIVYRLDVGDVAVAIVTWAPDENGASVLTTAEREVVRGISGGLSNAAIARMRGTAVRTVANQVASVFRKLGVRSRGELLARGALLR